MDNFHKIGRFDYASTCQYLLAVLDPLISQYEVSIDQFVVLLADCGLQEVVQAAIANVGGVDIISQLTIIEGV